MGQERERHARPERSGSTRAASPAACCSACPCSTPWRSGGPGSSPGPSISSLYLLAGFLLLFGYNRYAGLREDASLVRCRLRGGRGDGARPPRLAAGIALAARADRRGHAAARDRRQDRGRGGDRGDRRLGGRRPARRQRQRQLGHPGHAGQRRSPIGLRGQVVLAACGAVLFASNVAPTEEIVLIAIESHPLAAARARRSSRWLSAGSSSSYSDFVGSEPHGPGRRYRDRWCRAPSSATPWRWRPRPSSSGSSAASTGLRSPVCLAQTVALGVAGSLGASAGRLLLLSNEPPSPSIRWSGPCSR